MCIRDRHKHAQILQGERDKAISTSKSLWRKTEEMKREKEEMQKRLDQQNFAAASQRGQVNEDNSIYRWVNEYHSIYRSVNVTMLLINLTANLLHV